ncbi:MAG: TldD/PmbA family protein [Lachnospiraceae bacterium]|nr:TldD/PmbA family protein [Lachnospiraceae bacterium]
MKVKDSKFILQSRPLLEELLARLLKRYPSATILATDAKSMRYRVSRFMTSADEDDLFSSRGFVVRVSDGVHSTEYSFNLITKELLDDICREIDEAAAMAGVVLPEGITESETHAVYGSEAGQAGGLTEAEAAAEKTAAELGDLKVADGRIYFTGASNCEIDPAEVSDEEILQKLRDISGQGLSLDERILDCICGASWQWYTKLFLSKDRDLMESILWTNGQVVTAAARGQEIKTYYKGYSGLGGMECIQGMSEGVKECVDATIDLLSSEPIVPGEYTCICSPEVTGMIAHEAFGHGVEMDMFVKKRALAEKYVGEYVASPILTMHDGALAAQESGSYFFDDEGEFAHDTIVIDHGILKSGISDSRSAAALGTEPTGNGRRESYKRKTYTRMTNTYFEAGDSTPEEMIASVDYGFLLENPSSGMEDPKNWGIQCMVNIAREIKDGKLTGRVFSPIVLTGYVPDLLKSITMLGNKVELGGGGMCGKGYKEWVKVSDGGPYIKATVRLG